MVGKVLLKKEGFMRMLVVHISYVLKRLYYEIIQLNFSELMRLTYFSSVFDDVFFS
jgi:hypothetical protein